MSGFQGDESYPKGASFPELLVFHMQTGTRPNGRPGQHGIAWEKNELAAVLTNPKDNSCVSVKTINNYIKGVRRPYESNLHELIAAFFGISSVYNQWRKDFIDAHRRFKAAKPDRTDAETGEQRIRRLVRLPFLSLSEYFKGREREIAQIEDHFFPNAREKAGPICVVIVGWVGIGKTRLAVEYGWRASGHTAAIFVNVGSHSSLRDALVAAGSQIPDMPSEIRKCDNEVVFNWICDWFSDDYRRLLILDQIEGANIRETLSQFLGCLSEGSVLITSRQTLYSPDIHTLILEPFNESAGIDFLLSRTRGRRIERIDDNQSASKLTHRLASNPLALELASAYISTRRLSFAEYLSLLDEVWVQVNSYASFAYSRYSSSLIDAWHSAIGKLSPEAFLFLGAISFFSSRAIPLAEIGVLPGTRLYECICELEEFSLLYRDASALSIFPQSLTQEILFRTADPDVLTDAKREAIGLIHEFCLGDPTIEENLLAWRAMLPHIESLLSKVDGVEYPVEVSFIQNQVGIFLMNTHHYLDASKFLNLSVELRISYFGMESPITFVSLSNAAAATWMAGQFDLAEAMYDKAAAALELTQGRLSDEYIELCNNIAHMYWTRRNAAKAREYFEKSIEAAASIEAYPRDKIAHIETAFGAMLEYFGEYAEAEFYFQKSYDAYLELGLVGSPDAMRLRLNMADIAAKAGDFDKSICEYEEILRIHKIDCADEHVEAGSVLNRLGLVLLQAEECQRALECFEKVRLRWADVLPDDHFDMATLFNNIGLALHELGRFDEALQFHKQAMDIRMRIFGEDGLDTLESVSNIGALYIDLHRRSEAVEAFSTEVEARSRIQGGEHPLTRRAISLLRQAEMITEHPAK